MKLSDVIIVDGVPVALTETAPPGYTEHSDIRTAEVRDESFSGGTQTPEPPPVYELRSSVEIAAEELAARELVATERRAHFAKRRAEMAARLTHTPDPE